MTKPDTITVVTKSKEEIEADTADIFFSVSGSSSFFGDEAFKKAQEVKVINEMLLDAGIEESRIKLRNVQIDSSAFSVLKPSSATYSIKIAKVELSLLPKVLGILGDQKNCNLNRLEWIYSTADEVRIGLRATALKMAMEQARLDAEILGVNLLGVYDLMEEYQQDSVSREYVGVDDFAMASMSKARRSKSSIELGVALGNATNVRITLRVQFRISQFCKA